MGTCGFQMKTYADTTLVAVKTNIVFISEMA